MGLGFNNIPDRKGYLKQAGVQMNAKLLSLAYNATEAYEYFDIEIETADGKLFRERTFGANIDKVYPKDKWDNGQKVGTETKQEAFDRVQEDISKKLFWLGMCFVDRDTLKAKVGNARDLRELVGKVNAAIGDYTKLPRINFLTMWKNSDTKRRSNLIIADRVQWCEPTTYGAESRPNNAGIKLTGWQVANCMVEKYPYNGGQDVAASTNAVVGTPEDLPF